MSTKKSRASKKKPLIEDERAARRLIRRHIKRRDWRMVSVLFCDLGMIFEEQEANNGKA